MLRTYQLFWHAVCVCNFKNTSTTVKRTWNLSITRKLCKQNCHSAFEQITVQEGSTANWKNQMSFCIETIQSTYLGEKYNFYGWTCIFTQTAQWKIIVTQNTNFGGIFKVQLQKNRHLRHSLTLLNGKFNNFSKLV